MAGLYGKFSNRSAEDKEAIKKLQQELHKKLQEEREAELAALQTVNEGEIRYTLVVAASGTKGGFLRESHPEIASGVIYAKCTSMEGIAYTTVPSTKDKLAWNDPNHPEDTMLESTIAISMSLEDMEIFESNFNARPESSQRGRAVEFDVITSDTFTMNVSGIFFANGLKWLGDMVAPKGTQPSTAEEQRELARANRATSIEIRNNRIEAGRAARRNMMMGNTIAQTSQTTQPDLQPSEVAEISEEDLSKVGV
ncbi:hypothetical protein H6G33_09735 [Calothrix sp. FACHB-1219]|nr:hypothetical protein [Calothrix sp. FACHB-1219]MBD2217313.1 hypothetical protein [Calothrix sp. FACHB-1219]